MARLLEKEPMVDSVFAASDLMAIGAMKTLKGHNRRVPQDVQVVGFDDQAAARLSDPALTTVRQPFIEIGVQLVRQLVGLIHGDKPSGTTFPLELVVRDSIERPAARLQMPFTGRRICRSSSDRR